MEQGAIVPQSTATYREIVSQAEAWDQAWRVVVDQSAALLDLWAQGSFGQVIFTGCGSTYYLALAAAALFQELTGCPARGVPAGELVMYPSSAYARGKAALLVAVSRSGATTETLRAVQAFRQKPGRAVVVITNYPERPLAQMGTLTLAVPAGQEESIAQTRSFASMYVAAVALSAVLAGRDDLLSSIQSLPERGAALLRYESLVGSLGIDLALDRFYFLGSGPRYGLACEVNLKMKEMSLTHSEPFHFLEFRHGPKSMAGPTALVVGLLSELNRAYEGAVLNEMAQLGARTLVLGERGNGTGVQVDIDLDSRMPEEVRNVLYLPVLQLLSCYRSCAKGLNPDRPNNLDAVVKLD